MGLVIFIDLVAAFWHLDYKDAERLMLRSHAGAWERGETQCCEGYIIGFYVIDLEAEDFTKARKAVLLR